MDAMARKSKFHRLIEVAAVLPWWISLLLGIGLYFGFSYLAHLPPASSNLQNFQVARPLVIGFSTVLQFFVPFVFLLAAFLQVLKSTRRKKLLESQTGLDTIKELGWRDFEKLIGEIYRLQGYSIFEVGGGGADGGVDLIARKDGEKYLIQCKHWKKYKIDVKTVREFLGVLYRAGASGGMIVTTGEFTDPAKKEAADQALELINGPRLLELANLADPSRSRQYFGTGGPRPEQACPRCGAKMIVRENRKTGEKFWGCSDFPTCRGTKHL